MSFVHVFILLSALGLKTLGTSSLLFEHGSEGVFKSFGLDLGNKGTLITTDNAHFFTLLHSLSSLC